MAADKPTPAPVSNYTSPPPVEYDDSHVRIDTSLSSSGPDGISAGTEATFENSSDGSSYSLGLSTFGVPGAGNFGLGPRGRVGGLSMGFFADGETFTPQVGIGGMRITPEMGLAVGFWHAGPAGAGLIAPETMLVIAGMELAKSLIETEAEDARGWPLAAAATLASNFVPTSAVLDTASTLGVSLGLGPEPTKITTTNSLSEYQRQIGSLRGFNARSDAGVNLQKMLATPQDPFVEAELRSLQDQVLFDENEKGIPSSAIEENIRQAVGHVERFSEKYGAWLADGGGPTPSDEEVRSYMAYALYLAKKLNFQTERKDKDGRASFEIRRSEPFQIKDGELATRYIEVIASVYHALGEKASGPSAYIAARTETLSSSFLSAVREFQTGGINDETGGKLMEADARLVWHLGWIQTMGLLYQRGFFHRRREHVRWIVGQGTDIDNAATLDQRIRGAELPEMRQLGRNLSQLSFSGALSPERYAQLKRGVAAIQAADEIAREGFPDEYGGISLLFDERRARNWTRRTEIVDGLYRFAPSVLAGYDPANQSDDEDASLVRAMSNAGADRLVEVIRQNPYEARREWYAYCARPEAHLEGSWKAHVIKRTEGAIDNIEGLDTARLTTAIGKAGPDEMQTLGVRTAASDRIKEMKEKLEALNQKAKGFRVGRFSGLKDLRETEARDSTEVAEVLGYWFGEVLPAYAALKAELVSAGLDGDKEIKKILKAWDSEIAETGMLLEKTRVNYERFNSKRVGAFFLPHLLKRAGIDPTIPRKESHPF